MFVFGLIVGIVLGAIGFIAVSAPLVCKLYNVSIDEFVGGLEMIYDGGHDRESTMSLWKDGRLVDTVVFEERE